MRWLFVLVLSGCHVGFGTWQGARPRAGADVKVALHADDAAAKDLAREVLARDPLVTVVDIDASVVANGREAACAWAKQHGVDYYVTGGVDARYSSEFVCTRYETGSILDKNDPPCAEGHHKNQRTTATFALGVYDVTTCELAPGLATRVETFVDGEEDVSKPAALAELVVQAPAKAVRFPSQVRVAAGGTVDAPDGYYARYRDGRYRGYVAVEGGRPRVLHCCEPLAAGDALVARGTRKLLELAITGAVGSLTVGGERHLAPGVGAHVRYHPLDTGLQLGFGADLFGGRGVDATAILVGGEAGWGFRPSSAVALSANVGVGLAHARQAAGASQDGATALAPHATATLRAISTFATWWYVGADVGFVYSAALDGWDGDGAAAARPMSVRSPLARLWIGLDL